MADAVQSSLRTQGKPVLVHLKDGMEKARGTWGVRALQVAAFGAVFLGAAGLAVSHVIERTKNSAVAKNQKDVLTDYYRKQVATQLGIDPNKVTAKDLELAARVNPMFRNAIAKVDRELDSANRTATLSTGGALAAGAAAGGLGLLPGGSGIAAMAAKGAVDITGSVAGSAVSSLFDKDVLHTQDMMEHLNEKRTKGEKITAADIVMLRISQDEALQADLKKRNGVAFHKMDEAGQHAVMASMADMADAETMAERINSGAMSEQDVLMAAAPAPAPGSWAARVGGPRAGQRTSFVSQVNAQRAAAQAVSGGIV